MQTISIHDYGFLITTTIAPYFMLAANKKAGNVPDEIRQAIDAGTFDQMAAECRLGYDYHNPLEAKDCLETAYGTCRLVFVSDFEGGAVTLHENPEESEDKYPDNIDEAYECETIVYLPMLKAPSMFAQAYAGKDQMVKEIRNELASLGVKLPESFSDQDVSRHIVEITGTTCV